MSRRTTEQSRPVAAETTRSPMDRSNTIIETASAAAHGTSAAQPGSTQSGSAVRSNGNRRRIIVSRP
jgi:hypothetical protein